MELAGRLLESLAEAWPALLLLAFARQSSATAWPSWLPCCSGMAQAGTPGDELMLRAVADHFGFSVNIATSDAFMW